jgi:DNA-binding NarL/FixJ family response regulator
MATNFVLIDSHPIVCEGMRLHIAQLFNDANFLYTGGDLKAASAAAARKDVDCVIIDPTLNSEADTAAIIRKARVFHAPIFVMSHENSSSAVSEAFSAGATGFFPKSADIYQLRQALKTVMSGGIYISPEVAAKLSAGHKAHVKLSDREKTALVLYTSGLTMEQVALSMSIASSTANEYIDRARAKFRAIGKSTHNKVELRRLAVEEGLLVNA